MFSAMATSVLMPDSSNATIVIWAELTRNFWEYSHLSNLIEMFFVQ